MGNFYRNVLQRGVTVVLLPFFSVFLPLVVQTFPLSWGWCPCGFRWPRSLIAALGGWEQPHKAALLTPSQHAGRVG